VLPAPLSRARLSNLTLRFSFWHHYCIIRLADLFTAGVGFSNHFCTVFTPITGELDLIGKNPDCARTLRAVDKYVNVQEELRSAVAPELELVESRVIGPVKELQGVLKMIRKSITKRDHKVRVSWSVRLHTIALNLRVVSSCKITIGSIIP
jgi:hypothetical protein